MRTGLTLVELAVVVVCLGILALAAAPALVATTNAAMVRTEVARLVAAIDAARGAAARFDTVAALAISPGRYRVTIDTTMAWQQRGPADDAVAITGTGAPILFGPDGLAMGVSNRTITLTRGGASRRVVISRLGRLTY